MRQVVYVVTPILLLSTGCGETSRSPNSTVAPAHEAVSEATQFQDASKDSRRTRLANPDEGASATEFLREHLSTLMSMKEDPTFKLYGFGRGWPHYQWLDEVQAERKKDFCHRDGVALGTLVSLGMDYAMEGGKESEYTRWAREQIEEAIRQGTLQNEQPEVRKATELTTPAQGATATDTTKWRTWTAADGKHAVEAAFAGKAFNKVKLVRKDTGKTIEVQLETLSDADREWVQLRRQTSQQNKNSATSDTEFEFFKEGEEKIGVWDLTDSDLRTLIYRKDNEYYHAFSDGKDRTTPTRAVVETKSGKTVYRLTEGIDKARFIVQEDGSLEYWDMQGLYGKGIRIE